MTTNLINKKIYIGQHQKTEFDNYYFGSGKLVLKAIKKYRKENFKVELLHGTGTIEHLNELEIMFIEKYNSMNRKIGYNISFGGNSVMKGIPCSEEAKEKNRQSQLGKKHSEETKRKMSVSGKGRKHKAFSEETKKKMSLSHIGLPSSKKGIPLSEEQKIKLSITCKKKGIKPPSNKGNKWSDEIKEKIRKGNLGKVVSQETKDKLRCANKGKPKPEGFKNKIKKDWYKYHTPNTFRKKNDKNDNNE